MLNGDIDIWNIHFIQQDADFFFLIFFLLKSKANQCWSKMNWISFTMLFLSFYHGNGGACGCGKVHRPVRRRSSPDNQSFISLQQCLVFYFTATLETDWITPFTKSVINVIFCKKTVLVFFELIFILSGSCWQNWCWLRFCPILLCQLQNDSTYTIWVSSNKFN